MRYKAPENCTGISVGGEYFNVEDGHITVPDDGDYHNLVIPHGFIPATYKPTGKKRTTVAEPEPTASTAVAE